MRGNWCWKYRKFSCVWLSVRYVLTSIWNKTDLRTSLFERCIYVLPSFVFLNFHTVGTNFLFIFLMIHTFVNSKWYILYLHLINILFGIAASTLFGKFLTVKNVRCTWYRLSNITVYSFHTLSTFLTVKNVTLTWYRLSNITVYSFQTLMTFLFF